MNNKEELLKNVLDDISKDLDKKAYKQSFRCVKLEFIKDTINDLFNAKNIAELLNDNLKLNSYELKMFMLNGAEDFTEWSFGGCGMVYNDELREAFNKPKMSGEKLLNLQAYCFYCAYLELSLLIKKKLITYEKK